MRLIALKTWLLLAAVACVAPVVAQTNGLPEEPGASAHNPHGPGIQFDSMGFDFGNVTQGDKVQHDFVFTNTGDAVLEIVDVKPGCGCTTADGWDRRVEPGKSGIIPIQFNSANFSGKVAKTVHVTSNAPGRANLMLQISATVWRPIELKPATIVFNVVKDDQQAETKSLRIVNSMEEPITLSDLQCSNPSFMAELTTVQPGKEFELRITSIPPFAPEVASAIVTIKTSSVQVPLIKTGAYATLVDAVAVMPARLTLIPGPQARPYATRVVVRNNTREPLVLSNPTVNAPGAKVEVKDSKTPELFHLSVEIPAGFELKPGDDVAVTVNTNHPKYPVIRVPLVLSQKRVAQPKPAEENEPGSEEHTEEEHAEAPTQ